MAVTAKSQKSQAPGQSAAKVDAPSHAPVTVQLTRSWLKYVKDLPGADKDLPGAEKETAKGKAAGPAREKAPIVGDDAAKKTETPPTVGGDLPQLRDEPQPSTVHDGKKYETKYAAFGETLIDNGAQLEDVQQGYLADCYLVAAMGAVAMQRPDLIAEMIKDNGDGTVTVMLYTKSAALAPPGEGKATPVRISTQLPTANGRSPAYARSPSKELWPSLIEKAYVSLNGGGDYQGVNAGGSPGDAMSAMLGTESADFSTRSMGGPQILTRLSELLKGGKPVVAASFGKDAAKDNEPLKKLADEKGVHAWHAYVVKSADPTSKLIELFNPWGSDHPQKLTGEEFLKLYTWVYTGNPKAPEKTPT